MRFSPRAAPLRSSSDAPAEDLTPHRRLLISLTLLLLLLSQGKLVAQQGPPSGQAWSQADSYGMYAPRQEPDYARPEPYLQQRPSYSSTDQQGYQQPLGPQQLEQLVAPIALYPDALLAQVLTASTYPDQVRYVDQWRQAQGDAPPEYIAAAADEKNWDPSLKALTAFPQVLAQMAQNLQWTSDLGNAYYNQPQDVLGAVQVMRQRAQAAGNLQSTPQEAVNYYGNNVQLAPQNPNVVYVPSYDPWSVYGRSDSPSPYPGFSLVGALGQFLGSSPVSYGLGILMTVFNHTPWGWLSWGLNWLTQSVLFQNNNYFSHSTTVADWGMPHGGPRAFRSRPGFTRTSGGFHGDRFAFGRGYQTGGNLYGRRPPVRSLMTRFEPPARTPFYGRPRPNYGPGMYSRSGDFNRMRAGSIYGRPDAMYRQAETSQLRPGFNPPIYRGPAQNYRWSDQRTPFAGGYPRKANRSGGFHLFGSGNSSKGFGGGSHRGSFGGGHGHFGGHAGGHFGGHGGGGGHFHGHHR